MTAPLSITRLTVVQVSVVKCGSFWGKSENFNCTNASRWTSFWSLQYNLTFSKILQNPPPPPIFIFLIQFNFQLFQMIPNIFWLINPHSMLPHLLIFIMFSVFLVNQQHYELLRRLRNTCIWLISNCVVDASRTHPGRTLSQQNDFLYNKDFY